MEDLEIEITDQFKFKALIQMLKISYQTTMDKEETEITVDLLSPIIYSRITVFSKQQIADQTPIPLTVFLRHPMALHLLQMVSLSLHPNPNLRSTSKDFLKLYLSQPNLPLNKHLLQLGLHSQIPLDLNQQLKDAQHQHALNLFQHARNLFQHVLSLFQHAPDPFQLVLNPNQLQLQQQCLDLNRQDHHHLLQDQDLNLLLKDHDHNLLPNLLE